MCSAYTLKTTQKAITADLDIEFENLFEQDKWDQGFRFGSKDIPVLEKVNGVYQITKNSWPVSKWYMPNTRLSRLKPEKNGDTGLERVYEMRLWKEGFKNHHCITPITTFQEPAYWGDHAGEAINFKSEKDDLLFCASIKFKPTDPPISNWSAFSLLTHVAGKQMLGFHHRELVFLKPKDAVEWMNLSGGESEESFQFLMDSRYRPKYETGTDRKLKSYTPKNIESHKAKLDEEMKYVEFLEAEGVPG